MAVDKLVDSTQLDADLTSVANAIRTKGGTSADLAFPSGFVSAVEAIPSGGNIQVATGEITILEDISSPGATESKLFPGIALSFQPDFLWIAQTKESYLRNIGGVFGLGACKKSMMPVLRAGSTANSENNDSEYVFLQGGTNWAPQYDEYGEITNTGYGIASFMGSTLNQGPLTIPTWSVNSDGTFSYGRASNSAQIVLKGGTRYRYFAIKA